MSKKANLSNIKFGSLIAISHVNVNGRSKWNCVCDCGNERIVNTEQLVAGKIKSCGCAKKRDLSGSRFGILTVIERVSEIGELSKWLCKCDCGKEKIFTHSLLVAGGAKSCNCQRFGKGGPKNGHKLINSAEYRTWGHMKQRCLNLNNDNFHHYGGRGITICDRWVKSFENFMSDMGVRPTNNHSLERIDVNGNYEPSNCCWATKKEQAQNRRDSTRIEYKGEVCTITEWARRIGISPSCLFKARSKGRDLYKLIETKQKISAE